jgi:hypothetical protein
MDTKICECCLENLEIVKFSKSKETCKKCIRKKYKEDNKQKIKEQSAKYRQKNKEKIKRGRLEYKQKNKEKLKENRRLRYIKNKDKSNKQTRAYYAKNKDKLKEFRKKYNEENKEKIQKRLKAYRKEKIKTDPSYKLSSIMSNGIWSALNVKNSSKKGSGWEKLLGYSRDDLRLHLESKFTPEMTWENYGSYWHIDHIVPKSWFNYSCAEDEAFKVCWGLANLQPLPAKENLSKNNRWAG